MADPAKIDLPADPPKKEGFFGKFSHIRWIGDTSSNEAPHTSVFGKLFHRGKWVPVANLTGENKDKAALSDTQQSKLAGNPAFQLGDGKDKDLPAGVEVPTAEEA